MSIGEESNLSQHETQNFRMFHVQNLFICTSLATVNWNARACSIGGNLFGANNNIITTFTFGDRVGQVPDYLCQGMSGLTTITLPESVTNIGVSTFEDCGSLASVTIGQLVTSIGDNAFGGCNRLESVTIHAVTPPEIWSNTFDDYGMPLYVPAGCKSKYQDAKYWRNFTNIKELTSSVETVLDSDVRIYVENHTLHVENVEGDYRVYTATGQLVYEGHDATVSLVDAGVYVVRTSSRSQKVIVK